MTATVNYSRPPLILGDLVRHPMPKAARGALLRSVSRLANQPVHTTWVSVQHPGHLRPGSILLSWEPSPGGGMDVTARLGLASAEVVLATWPDLHGDWTPIVHPTVFEVLGLHAALMVATDALHLSNHLAAAS
ncbi:esterase [Streptomyces sp. NBC_00827]|uniref:esterase n=1 Tax=Streptomyces sp. NBC_00827 TaxID=2903677 RepID=UPI00386F89B6|nr:esterase [Streptomyces sp. NBC_00827]